MTPMDDPLAAPASMPARRACGAGGRSPVLPASSDTTLDFTTPQDTAATRANTAGTEPPPVMYITEKHIVFSELPDRSRQGHFTATDDADAASWQLLGLERAGQEAHVSDWDGADRCWRTGAGEVSEGCHTIAAVASVLSGLQQDSQAELEGALQNAWDEAADGLATEAEVDAVPETAAKCSPDRPAASLHWGISPAGRLGFLEAADGRACAAGREATEATGTELDCTESLSVADRQEAFLEGLRSPQLDAVGCAEPAADPGQLKRTDAGERRCGADALGLACSPQVPAWGAVQQPVPLWAAYHYEGPDILDTEEQTFQQPAAPAKAADCDAMQLEEDLLSPIHRHPLALDGCSHGPAHKHGLSRRIAAGKRAHSELGSPRRKLRRSFPENSFAAEALQLPASPIVEEAVLLSGAGAGSPGMRHMGSAQTSCAMRQRSGQLLSPTRQPGSPRGRRAAGDGGCSVLQELSNEANQQAADLERLLTPPRGAPLSVGVWELALLDNDSAVPP
jgi:hypothetical protein